MPPIAKVALVTRTGEAVPTRDAETGLAVAKAGGIRYEERTRLGCTTAMHAYKAHGREKPT